MQDVEENSSKEMFYSCFSLQESTTSYFLKKNETATSLLVWLTETMKLKASNPNLNPRPDKVKNSDCISSHSLQSIAPID